MEITTPCCAFKTIGTRSNRDGIGAKVTIVLANGSHQMQMVKSGSSYLSQSELPLTFGLGKPRASNNTVRLEVTWPTGRSESVSDIEPDRAITLEEGKGMISSKPISW